MSAISHSSFLLAGDANDVVHSAILQRLVDLRLGEGGVGAERQSLAFSLLALDLGHQQFVPVLGAGHVTRSQLRRQTIAVLVEQQQWVVADGLEMAVIGAAFLLAMDGALGGVHVENDAIGVVGTFCLRQQFPGSPPSTRAGSLRLPAVPSRSCATWRLAPHRDPRASWSRSDGRLDRRIRALRR